MAPQNVDTKCPFRQASLKNGQRLANPEPGAEVVISGLSGRYPEAENVHEFRDNLLNKVDMLTDDERRWKHDNPEVPRRSGKVKEVRKFDADFFNISAMEAESMDPMCRILLENVYEAIVDSGLRPSELRGQNVAVLTALCYSESERNWCYDKVEVNGYGVTGCSRAFFANRISYWLGVNGMSYSVDSACSSGLNTMEQAYRLIRDDLAEAVLVCSSNLVLLSKLTLQFARLGVLSQKGDCRPFDNNASGYVRSEAVCAVFLQKAKDAKRIYATVVHAKSNCDGFKPEGITYPAGAVQKLLLEQFYEECGVDPATLDFLEAHGTGTRVGDPEELDALDKVFCTNRKTPLPIGSIRSNMGHPEPVSGLCSISKVILCMETGILMPNLNYSTPRDGVEGLIEGRMKVVTEPTPWNGGLVGVNSFGFGGANTHVLLRSNPKIKVNGGQPRDCIPRLVIASGRTREAVNTILADIESRPPDAEHVRLMHDIHAGNISNHMYRGYSLLLPGNRRHRDIKVCPEGKRPLWFVFSGIGSQWAGMGQSLLQIPAFAAAIQKCERVLKSKGINVTDVISSDNPRTFDSIVNTLVGVTAVQIGLVDILVTIGIAPDGIIGHSVGELICAYSDGAFTVEQTVLAAYYMGMALHDSKASQGAMATVGLGLEQLQSLCPSGIEVACHNGPQSNTISGPAEAVRTFLGALQSKKIPVQDVQSCNIALHSQSLAETVPRLVHYLNKAIHIPKPRSNRWMTSSVPEAEWGSKMARFISAEYFANNLLHPVLWEEASQHIPTNAITVEISPRRLLDGPNVALSLQGMDGTESLLTALGNLYLEGVQMDLTKLYPAVSLPVSRGTPMISPLIKWDHSHDWYSVSKYDKDFEDCGERIIIMNTKLETDKFYLGHMIDGRYLFPAAGYLVLAWETLAQMHSLFYGSVDVVFEDVRFNRATHIGKDVQVEFIVTMQRRSGNFEVEQGGATIVTGRIRATHNVSTETDSLEPPVVSQGEDLVELSNKDIYKELRLRGYNYAGLFRSLVCVDTTGTYGKVRWENNWVTLLDNLLQIKILGTDTRGLYVPTAIDKITIDVHKFYEVLNTIQEDPVFPIHVYKDLNIIRSTGIEIRGLKASPIARRKALGEPVLECYQFMPHCATLGQPLDLHQTLRMCVHIILESYNSIKVKAVELLDEVNDPQTELLAPELVNILGDLPFIQPDITVLARPEDPRVAEPAPGVQVENGKLESEKQTCLLVMATDIVNRPEVLQTAMDALTKGGFIIARERSEVDIPNAIGLELVVDQTIAGERILLFKKVLDTTARAHSEVVVWITESNYDWLPVLQTALKDAKPHQRVVLVAQGEPFSGILGLFNCVRKEPGGDVARCFFILDDDVPLFNPNLDLYRCQLNKDLAVNVLQDSEWGSYRHLLIQSFSPVSAVHAFNKAITLGDLSSLTWCEGPLNPDRFMPTEFGVTELVHVYYSALNFRDVLVASGRLALDIMYPERTRQDCTQGLEFSGRSLDGRRVMGMVPLGGLANVCEAVSILTWDVPDDWSLEDAATVPIVYGTVLHGFFIDAHIMKGESILIHSGSGGVGQAAINVALHYGLTVYTTVGTQEKRDFIKEQFPQLTDRHIGNSRDTSFEQMIMRETNGRGVDLVLNSLAEEKLQASVRCLAKNGRFLEIGKFDLANNNSLNLALFEKGISYYGVMLDVVFTSNMDTRTRLHNIVARAIAAGAVRPLRRIVFEYEEAEQAFRYMTAGKHIGKVLIKIQPEESQKQVTPLIKTLQARPRYYCNPNLCFVIVGGLGGFGLELADWLVMRGARKLLLGSRTGIRNGYQSLRVRTWRGYGATIHISTADISTVDGVTALLNEAIALGPVGGIFNLAVVLHDALLENQTEEKFLESAKTKALATRHLDMLSRRMCPELQHFVVFSSVSCGRGNAGQTNYGMANSVMERVCEARMRDGLPGLAVQWGAVGDVGLVADMQDDNRELVIGGTLQQKIDSCLNVLDGFLKQKHPVVASMVVAEKRACGKAGSMLECVVNIIGIRDIKTVSPGATLAELGMDSMTGVEIKQMLEREYEIFLTPQEIRDMTVAKLCELDESMAEKEDMQEDPATSKQLEGLHLFMSVLEEDCVEYPVELPLPSQPGSELTFLVPGIVGNGIFLKPLAAGLNGPVVALQMGNRDPGRTVLDMMSSLLSHVKSRLSPGEPFRLVGYSFGGLLALEMAMALEAEGHRGRLVLLDSSPDFLHDGARAIVPENPDLFEVSLLIHMLDLLEPVSTSVNDKLREELHKLVSLEARIAFLLGQYPNLNVTSEYTKVVLDSIRLRFNAILQYKWMHAERLISPVLLLRPTAAAIVMDNDYHLHKYCEIVESRPFISGNHMTIVDHPDTATHINEFLNREAELHMKTFSLAAEVAKSQP